MKIIFLFISISLSIGSSQFAYSEQTVFDMHMHYKWSQKEVTSPEAAIQFLDEHDISHAVVIGKPAKLALSLKKLAPERIIAFYSPYRESLGWFRWQHDKTVVTRAAEALKSGEYSGIGELHIIGGFAPKQKSKNVLDGLMKLSEAYDTPIMLHTEFSNPDFMLKICESYPKTRIIWAHAGAILKPTHIDTVMTQCKNVWSGMAARDPWRYVDNQHTDSEGKLLEDWKALFIKYPNRFMVGSDTVWPVEQLDAWDVADTGWQELGKFWDFHRSWLKQLPPEVAKKIMHTNALHFFE
ncbi:MAG: Unknown protein [uncultured Thiotrichaceae bacterium]|uniref:Amidohydrolase-related domain-containing protein n=1 Tax=uncultured Thiotrichaceae bacterium TaxID=298394 RepID=A0A6S6U2E7_9GAMM|nr:MAG: Unknown protein [uncultured Thiotrichaceae bacterium]